MVDVVGVLFEVAEDKVVGVVFEVTSVGMVAVVVEDCETCCDEDSATAVSLS